MIELLKELQTNKRYNVSIRGTMVHQAESILRVSKKALIKDIVIRKNYRDGDYWKLQFDDFTLLFCINKIARVLPIAGGLCIVMPTYCVEITSI